MADQEPLFPIIYDCQFEDVEENDYLGGGQGQVVAKSCHFFDSNEVKCIHHPISQKSGDFVIFFLQTIYIVQKSGLGRS